MLMLATNYSEMRLYILKSYGSLCVFADVDECGGDPCDSEADCNNTVGSFMCTCCTGFSGDGMTCIGAFKRSLFN